MTRNGLRRMTASAAVALGPIVTAAVYLPTRPELPEPLPVHWNFRGEVDGTASQATVAWMSLTVAVVLAVWAVIAIYRASPPVASRFFAALLGFGTWIIAGAGILSFALSAGAASADDVSLPWWAIAALLLVPAAIAAGLWLLLPGAAPTDRSIPLSSTLHFAPGETVVWLDHIVSSVARWTAALAAVIAAVMVIIQPVVAIPFAVVAVAVASISQVTVRIDSGGVHTLWGPLGWPRSTIALDEIEAARAEQLEPAQWGGWGYRMSKRGVAVVIRRGPAIILSRRGRSDYAVTVPHAADGVEVIAALLIRSGTAG